MSIDQIMAEALRLPTQQRAILAESLWASLGEPTDAFRDVDDHATVALALERDRQLEAGEVQSVSHKEMMARLRS